MIRTLSAAILAALICAPVHAADAPVDRLRAVLSPFDDHIRRFSVTLEGCQLELTYFQDLGSTPEKRRKTWQIWRQDLAAIRLSAGAPEKGESTWRFVAPRRAGDAALAEQVRRFAAAAYAPDHPAQRLDWAGYAVETADRVIDWRRFSSAPLDRLMIRDTLSFEAEADPSRDAAVFAALTGAPAPFSIKLEAETRSPDEYDRDAPSVMFAEVAPPLRSPILTLDEAEAFGAALRDHAAAHCPEALR